ncbi:MAG: hypothetical protein IV086_10865 [Hyphomonadaceae bacterium]|nr:hypothetical protein [Hyphomonadaceae bacterium]
MSIRFALLATVFACAGAAFRFMPDPGEPTAALDPPHAAARAASPSPPLDPETLRTLEQSPLTFVGPIDPAKIPQPAVDPDALRLLGVVSGSGRALAILTNGGGAPQTMARGEEIGGWRVASISERRVRLTRGGDTIEKILFERARQPPADPAAPVAETPRPTARPPQPPAAPPRAQAPANTPPAIYMPPAPPITQ